MAKESFNIQPVKKIRFVHTQEPIILSLTPESLKLYMIFRLESDYAVHCSSVKKNIKFLMNKTGFARRQVFYSLKELELFGLLKRETEPGYQSVYWVSDELYYFNKPIEEPPKPEIPENPEPVEIDQEPVQDTHGVVQDTHGVVQDTHTIFNNSFQQSSHVNTIVDFDKSTDYRDDALFMMFYSIYPNKQKPDIARKAFYKHKPTPEFVSMLVTDVKARVENNWKHRHKSKIPFPATYLNGKEWEGEIYKDEPQRMSKPKYKTMDDILEGVL